MTTFRILVSGQSNSIGRGEGGPAWRPPLHLKAWNTDNFGDHFPGWSPGSAWVAPALGARPFWVGRKFQNFGYWFAHAYAGDHPAVAVRHVLAGKGGTGINAWTDGAAPMRDRLLAVWASTGLGAGADVFLWHQGEHDHARMTTVQYTAKLTALIEWLRDAGVLSPEAVVVIGGLARTSRDRIAWNKDLAAFAAATAGLAYADTRGLSTEVGSRSHFDGPSLKRLGERYYDAWQAAA